MKRSPNWSSRATATDFDLTNLISHRFPLEDAVAAIDLASHPQANSMKIVIQPGS